MPARKNSNQKKTKQSDALPGQTTFIDETEDGAPGTSLAAATPQIEQAAKDLAARLGGDSQEQADLASETEVQNLFHDLTLKNSESRIPDSDENKPDYTYYLEPVADGGILPNEMDREIEVPMSIRNIFGGAYFDVDTFRRADPFNFKTSLANDVINNQLNFVDLLCILQGLLRDNQICQDDLTSDKLPAYVADYASNYDTQWTFLSSHEHYNIINALSQLSVAMQVANHKAVEDGSLSHLLKEEEQWLAEETAQELARMAEQSRLNALIDSDDYTRLKKRKLASEQTKHIAGKNSDRNRASARRTFREDKLKKLIEKPGFIANFIWQFDVADWVALLKIPLSLKADDVKEGDSSWDWYEHQTTPSAGILRAYGRYVAKGTKADGQHEDDWLRTTEPTDENPEGKRTFILYGMLPKKDPKDANEAVRFVVNRPLILEDFCRLSVEQVADKVCKRTKRLMAERTKSQATEKAARNDKHDDTDSMQRTKGTEKGKNRRKVTPTASESKESESDDAEAGCSKALACSQIDSALADFNRQRETRKAQQERHVFFYDDLMDEYPSSVYADPACASHYDKIRNKLIVKVTVHMLHFLDNADRAFDDGALFKGKPIDRWKATAMLREHAITYLCQVGAFYGLPHIEPAMLHGMLPPLTDKLCAKLKGFMELCYKRSLAEWKKKQVIDARGERLMAFRDACGWEIEMENGESGIMAMLMKHDKVRRECEFTDKRLKQRGVKRNARMHDRCHERPIKRRKLCDGFEESIFDDEDDSDPPPPRRTSLRNPNLSLSLDTEPTTTSHEAQLESSADSHYFTDELDHLLDERQAHIDAHIQNPSRVRYVDSGLGSTAHRRTSEDRRAAISVMCSKLDIPKKNCSDPKRWAEKNSQRGTMNLSPLASIVDKVSGVFTVCSTETVAMRTKATVATKANKWMDFTVLESLHNSRKKATDVNKVVATVRGLNVCTQGCETPSALDL